VSSGVVGWEGVLLRNPIERGVGTRRDRALSRDGAVMVDYCHGIRSDLVTALLLPVCSHAAM
jgi:hypothetical protein